MGNSTNCSSESSSSSKNTSPFYKLQINSPLPERIPRHKGQTHAQPLFSHLKHKGNIFI